MGERSARQEKLKWELWVVVLERTWTARPPTHKEGRPGSKGGGNDAGAHTKEHVTSAGSAPGAARPWGQLQAPR